MGDCGGRRWQAGKGDSRALCRLLKFLMFVWFGAIQGGLGVGFVVLGLFASFQLL